MVPARTTSPVWRFTPRRLALLSRPLRELPPPFLCAICRILLRSWGSGFRRWFCCRRLRRRCFRSCRLVAARRGGILSRLSVSASRRCSLDCLGIGRVGCYRCRRRGLLLGLRRGVGFAVSFGLCGLGCLARLRCCLGLLVRLAAGDIVDPQLGELAAIAERAPVTLLGLVREDANLPSAPVRDHGCSDGRLDWRAFGDVGFSAVADEQHRLERDGLPDLDWNPVDKDPVAGSDSVLVTAVLKDCVHMPLSPGAGSLH